MFHKSQGKLMYGDNDKIIVVVDQKISDFYRSLIPKYKNAQPQYHRAHITVIRCGVEKPPIKPKVYENTMINFEYENVVYEGDVYFYLKAKSIDIGLFRLECGLPIYRIGYDCYHITIANKKTINN